MGSPGISQGSHLGVCTLAPRAYWFPVPFLGIAPEGPVLSSGDEDDGDAQEAAELPEAASPKAAQEPREPGSPQQVGPHRAALLYGLHGEDRAVALALGLLVSVPPLWSLYMRLMQPCPQPGCLQPNF